MCGSLKHSWESTKPPLRPNESFYPDVEVECVSGEKILPPVVWQGFARQETIGKWLSGGWKEGILSAVAFTEQGKEFTVPPGKKIRIIYLSRPEKTIVNIVTRPANTQEEKNTHPRFPAYNK